MSLFQKRFVNQFWESSNLGIHCSKPLPAIFFSSFIQPSIAYPFITAGWPSPLTTTMQTKASIVTFALLAVAELVAGHGAIIAATGDQGGNGSAIGSEYSSIS